MATARRPDPTVAPRRPNMGHAEKETLVIRQPERRRSNPEVSSLEIRNLGSFVASSKAQNDLSPCGGIAPQKRISRRFSGFSSPTASLLQPLDLPGRHTRRRGDTTAGITRVPRVGRTRRGVVWACRFGVRVGAYRASGRWCFVRGARALIFNLADATRGNFPSPSNGAGRAPCVQGAGRGASD